MLIQIKALNFRAWLHEESSWRPRGGLVKEYCELVTAHGGHEVMLVMEYCGRHETMSSPVVEVKISRLGNLRWESLF